MYEGSYAVCSALSSDQKLLTRACVYESSVMCNGRNLASKVQCVFRACARAIFDYCPVYFRCFWSLMYVCSHALSRS
jgi:hypothetical protein